MEATLYQAQQQIAHDIRELIRLLDSTHWRDQIESLKERLDEISIKMRETLQLEEFSMKVTEKIPSVDLPDTDEALQKMRDSLQSLSQQVDELRSQLSQKAADVKQNWREMRKHMAHAYENLASSLALQDIHVPHLRPTNYARSLFHMGNGFLALFMLQHTFSMSGLAILMSIMLCTAWGLEFFRPRIPALNEFLMKHFGFIAHPHEHHRVNSGTWYILALFLLSVSVHKLEASLAVIILGICDPAAAFVGRRWGRIRIYSGRTLEGSLTFFVTGVLLSVAVMAIYSPHLAWSHMLIVGSVASLLSAVAELFSKRIDDNLSIPLAAGWGAALTLLLLGIHI